MEHSVVPSTVSVWWCVSINGPRLIRRPTDRLDIPQYHKILEDIPPRDCWSPRDFVHDHNPVLCSKVVKQWSNNHLNLKFVNGPPCSTDIMPMSEYLVKTSVCFTN